MKRLDLQSDFVPYSIEEFMTLLREELPLWEEMIQRRKKLITVAKRLLCEKIATSTPSPCHLCPYRQSCTEPCDRLNALLPGLYKGKGRRENLTGLHAETLQGKERKRRKDIFEQYELWKDGYTQAQWEAIELYYNQCMSEMQIAKKLGKKRSAINGRLIRARSRKEERQKQLRRETREQIRKKEEKNDM